MRRFRKPHGVEETEDQQQQRLAAAAVELSRLKSQWASAPDTLIRCRFIDDAIISALSGGASSFSPYLNVGDTTEIPFCQVVFLGAGLDLRALRLPCLARESVTVFECDYEEILEFKRRKLCALSPPPGAYPTTIAIDLNSGSLSGKHLMKALVAAGFCKQSRTLFVAEGLFMYLSKASVISILNEISKLHSSTGSSTGSCIICDTVSASSLLCREKWHTHFTWGIDFQDIEPFFRSRHMRVCWGGPWSVGPHPDVSYGRYTAHVPLCCCNEKPVKLSMHLVCAMACDSA